MNAWLTLVLAAALIASADIQGASSSQHASPDAQAAKSGDSGTLGSSVPAPVVSDRQPSHAARPLQPESRLLLVRYVSGEFAKAVQALPGGKRGLKIPIGKPLSAQHLSDMLRLYGTAVSQGDQVQITNLVFRPREIVVQLNGGGKKPFHFREHLQIGVGMGGAVVSAPPETHPGEGTGVTLILDYGRALPDMSPDDLKHDLAAVLDFSKQHSAAVNWIDTLPPEMRQAIQERHAVVGMDREMVLAAMGRPDRKIRTRDADGRETEDWIYGLPPEKTTFVTFAGDNVIRVKDFD